MSSQVSPQIQQDLKQMVETMKTYVLDNLKKDVYAVVDRKFGDDKPKKIRWLKHTLDENPCNFGKWKMRAVEEVYRELNGKEAE